MEDMIEICAGCGKMPRPIDRLTGSFTCSRCGNHTTMQVHADSYEKTALELDKQFQDRLLKQKIEAAAKAPVHFPKQKKSKKAPVKKKKAAKKPAVKKRKK